MKYSPIVQTKWEILIQHIGALQRAGEKGVLRGGRSMALTLALELSGKGCGLFGELRALGAVG